jgi:hypothetical protein
MLPSGTLQISAATAADGAPVLQLQAPGVSPKRSFISRRWTEAKGRLHEQVAYFTAPGKGDRALQLLYDQLPYHPQRIDAHTARSFELTASTGGVTDTVERHKEDAIERKLLPR